MNTRLAGLAYAAAAVITLAGCSTERSPVAPPEQALHGAAAPSTTVSVRTKTGRSDVAFAVDGSLVQGRFNARFNQRGSRVAGVIEAEWTEATTGREVRFETELISMTLTGGHPTLRWTGRARFVDPATGRAEPWMDVVGTVDTDPAAPDCVIFDLVGGGVTVDADVPGTIRIRQ